MEAVEYDMAVCAGRCAHVNAWHAGAVAPLLSDYVADAPCFQTMSLMHQLSFSKPRYDSYRMTRHTHTHRV